MNKDLMTMPENSLSTEQVQAIAITVQGIVAPVLEQFSRMLENNTQAMERIAATQQMMSSRISDLEKQLRLKTPMSRSQEKHLADAIRQRARELLDAKEVSDDKKAVNKLASLIRKSILARYGVDSLREAPAYDYEVAMEQAEKWSDPLATRDVVKEAKHRKEDGTC